MTETKQTFEKTQAQKKAIRLLASKARHIMLYGGSRSGKTFIILRAIIIRACKTKSRHLCVRLKFNHIKTSIWHETLPKVMKLCFPDLPYELNKSDYFLTLPNGSEIWIAGLDEGIRTEKVLGKEFSTVFFNECSQLKLPSITMALTRLAEKNALKNKAYYDENPPSKKHWSYWHFIKHIDRDAEIELDPKDYACMVINPRDNLENIDQDYLQLLSKFAPKERARFLDGEFTEEEAGRIYYAFDAEKHVREIEYNNLYPIWCGVDFNVNPMTASLGQVISGVLYVFDEFYLKNSNTDALSKEIIMKYGDDIKMVPDSTGKKRTTNANKSDIQILESHFGTHNVSQAGNPFRVDRYAVVNASLSSGLVVISPRCKYTIKDLEEVSYKEGTNEPDTTDKMLTHCSDNLGYLIYRTINPLKNNKNRFNQTKYA